MHSLSAEVRSGETGKSVARKLRKDGKIPAVVYGDGEAATPLVVDPDHLVAIFRETQDRNTIVELDVGGEKVPTLVQKVQRHPLKRHILHVDFMKVRPGKPVEVMVPLAGKGRAKGMIIGGRLRLIRREVKVRCEFDKIPSVIEHDITPMDIGDMVKASELVTPEGVEVVFDNDFNVMTVYGRKVKAGDAK